MQEKLENVCLSLLQTNCFLSASTNYFRIYFSLMKLVNSVYLFRLLKAELDYISYSVKFYTLLYYEV